MADRVRAVKETHGGRYSRPWVVYVDGRKLLDGRGGQRRFKTEDAARDAGVRTAARGVAPPFARGSWQHAVDDQLVGFGRTSQEFSTPHDAVSWLLQQTGEAALATSATVSIDTLRQHWLRAMECNHATSQDKPHCSCSQVDLGWHPSIGAAVEAWLMHVSGVGGPDHG